MNSEVSCMFYALLKAKSIHLLYVNILPVAKEAAAACVWDMQRLPRHDRLRQM